jgi:fluoride exporter
MIQRIKRIARTTRRTHFVDSLWQILLHPIFLVGIGSAVGGVSRYYLGRWIDLHYRGEGGMPWGTFTINVSGSFILGVVGLIVLERLPANYRAFYLLMGTGFCGGFTTFSTFEWETFQLVRNGNWWIALVNVLGSFFCGFLGIFSAVLLVYGLLGRR